MILRFIGTSSGRVELCRARKELGVGLGLGYWEGRRRMVRVV